MFKPKFVIKDIQTGQYFIGWDYAQDNKGRLLQRKPVHPGHYYGDPVVKIPKFSNEEFPKLYNSLGGAKKVISEFTGQSFTHHEKMNPTQKVLYGSKDLTRYEIVQATLKIKD